MRAPLPLSPLPSPLHDSARAQFRVHGALLPLSGHHCLFTVAQPRGPAVPGSVLGSEGVGWALGSLRGEPGGHVDEEIVDGDVMASLSKVCTEHFGIQSTASTATSTVGCACVCMGSTCMIQSQSHEVVGLV